MLKYLIQTSIFRYSKNYGSLTHETRIKDAVNMGDLICLLATVRTLKRRKRLIKSSKSPRSAPDSSVTGKFNDQDTRAYPSYCVTNVHVLAIRMHAGYYFYLFHLHNRGESKKWGKLLEKLQHSVLNIRFV